MYICSLLHFFQLTNGQDCLILTVNSTTMTKITILVLFKLKKKHTSKYWIQWKLSWAASLREALTGYKLEGHPKNNGSKNTCTGKGKSKIQRTLLILFQIECIYGFSKKNYFLVNFFHKGWLLNRRPIIIGQ